MSDGTNPETGVTDADSAVKWLTTPEEEQPEADETEAAQEPQESEEAAEAEEAEAEEDQGGDADTDSEDEEAETEDEEPQYTVKVDGEEFEVNLSELVSGYQKGADYHRKTTALAEERKTLQQQAQQIEQLRGQLATELERVATKDQGQEPDWEKLADDPWEYARQRTAWEKSQRERQEAAQKAQALRQQKQVQAVQENTQKFLQHFPEWKDPKVAETERDRMRQAARDYGFSDQEFFSAVDYRGFLLLRDAMRGRKMAQAEKKPPVAKKVPKQAPKSLKPGSKATPSETRSRDSERARENLRKRGTVDDAVAWLTSGR